MKKKSWHHHSSIKYHLITKAISGSDTIYHYKNKSQEKNVPLPVCCAVTIEGKVR
jgi:hypothetical protein